MAVGMLEVWMLLVAIAWTQGCSGQHWSFGLSPGGKRQLDSFADALGNTIERLPPVVRGSVLMCPDESPLANFYRRKAARRSLTRREKGHTSYKK